MNANLNWLTDPAVFRVNRLDAHSDHVAYATVEEACGKESSLHQSLDGLWRFSWSQRPADRPADFWQDGYDLSGFGTVTVPGHFETQGYGQIQYTNKLYPWDGHAELRPPQVDWDHNPVGSYVREFDLDDGLLGKQVCICFQGVEQAFYVWLNGSFVGYSEDTFTPSDFDLTPYLKATGNRLCVEVYKRSSAAWLEDQDFFRFGGIFRSVFLYAKPSAHIDDVWFQTTLDPDNTTGHLKLRLLLTAPARIHCSIEGLFDGDLELTEQDGYLWSQELTFENIRLWDYGYPNLYRVMLTVHKGDNLTEAVPYDIGFRRFEMINKIMYLNGKRLMINGVNRHEWNPNGGRCISVKDMEDAMSVMLANNINAVRTCHYPNRSEWYHMCDKNGIYMMDETNLETHGSWQKDALPDSIEPSWNIPASLPEWRENVLDRANSMFQRDKNHVSILFWSCGNEAFCGTNVVAMADFFRSVDPSRLVHYESVYFTRGVVNGTPTSPHWKPEWERSSDMESRMYATPWDIREYLENDPPKPYISCEYMHNMGNSLGGLESYIRLGEDFPMYQGGFIWDYMDQALWYTNPNGEKVLGYGGDFGERQTDYNFSGNGIVSADHTPKPCMQEVRYWHSTPEARAAQDAANEAAMANAVLPAPSCCTTPLKVTHGDGNLGIKGENFEILFSYGQAGPASLVVEGQEWIYRAPKPTFWRAPTENDIGCGFQLRSAIWSAVDSYLSCCGRELLVDNENEVSIRYSYTAQVMPGLKTDVTYTVRKEGTLDVSVHYYGGENRPQLPVFGLRFPTVAPVEETRWLGLSGETYPDRCKGGVFGLHTEVPHIPNYLVPQECGCHMGTFSTELTMKGHTLILEKLDNAYAFSALPYTHKQLEDALHVEELPKPTRTVISLYGAMRGVGGIDTWGNDVEPAYHIHADKDIELKFRIHL